MAIILGNGAFRIWVGRNKRAKDRINIGIMVLENRFPSGIDPDKIIQQLVSDIEVLIYKQCPWIGTKTP